MKFIKTLIFALVMLLTVPLVDAQATTLTWDHSPDAAVLTNNIGYNMYARTNGVANTNFFPVGVINYPSNTFTWNPPAGVSISYYVTATNKANFAESVPSNTLDYTYPIGIPPANVLTAYGIASYTPQTKIWNNVSLSWTPVNFAQYGITNYTVVVESSTVTNTYNTTNATYTIPALARDDYKLYVQTKNSLGTSPQNASTTWVLSSAAPKNPTSLRTSP
jgi:hypothetical protein